MDDDAVVGMVEAPPLASGQEPRIIRFSDLDQPTRDHLEKGKMFDRAVGDGLAQFDALKAAADALASSIEDYQMFSVFTPEQHAHVRARQGAALERYRELTR